MLEGPDLEEVGRVAQAVPGRVRSTRVASARSPTWRGSPASRASSLTGVIVGKALYEKRFTVPEALAALDDSSIG